MNAPFQPETSPGKRRQFNRRRTNQTAAPSAGAEKRRPPRPAPTYRKDRLWRPDERENLAKYEVDRSPGEKPDAICPKPLLGVWGSDDQSTPPGQNPPLFAQALQQGGNTHYTFRFFSGASHDIRQSPDGGVTSLRELAPGYAEFVGSWVQAVTSGQLPQADAPVPPQQDWLSVPVPPLSWWESAWVQLVAFLLLLTAFAGYPLVALLRRLRGRSLRAAVGTPSRLLSGTGITVILCFFVYMLSLLISVGMGGQEVVLDPVLAGRPLLWLLLQMLALVTVGAEVATAVAWRRAGNSVSLGERRRLGLLLAGGALFILWALYWGLLLP